MAISFEELQGYPTCTISQGKFSGVRKFRVAWSDWPAFYTMLTGSYVNSGGGVIISPPATFPGVNHTYVTDVEIEGIGKITSGVQTSLSNDLNQYAYAFVTANYSYLPPPDDGIGGSPNIPSGTILTYSSNLGVEAITVEGRSWEFAVDNDRLPDSTPFGINVPTEDMQLSFMHVPMIPSALRKLRGKTNSAIFMGYPAETVLFNGAAISRDFQLVIPPNTPSMYRIDYHFLVKCIEDGGVGNLQYKGWNNFYRASGGSGAPPGYDKTDQNWLAIRAVGSGARPFPTADFSGLFQLV